MQHYRLRCKHCGKEYTYCTYGNGPEYGTQEGCSMEYCAECQKAIDEANYKQGYHDAVEKAWPFVYSMYQVGRDNLTPLTKDEFIKAMEEKYDYVK